MNDWNAFLIEQGAQVNHDGALEFRSAPSSFDAGVTMLVDLSHQGLLAVEGPDAAKFLQGQLTCDTRELANHTTRLGAQCDLKGRMLTSFRALQLTADAIFLRMHQGLITATKTSLGKYSVFSKVTLTDRSNDYRHFGLVGANAAKLLANFLMVPALAVDEWSDCPGGVIIKLNDDQYECWLTADKAKETWLSLAPHCQLAGSNLWTLLAVRAGLGEIRPETRELFTPQALNFQLVNAINFRKGCYTGQEIVARLHYRGVLKRHMYRLGMTLAADEKLPAPGDGVTNKSGKQMGEIVMAARSSDGLAEALVTIQDASLDEAYIAGGTGKKLEQLDLPYAIPREDKPD